MPVLQPAENWEKTGRYAIEELFKLEDRKGSPMVLAMTHEEAVTDHVAREVRSYRDLPLMLFHIQTKERDEPRPRAGVLRTREFTMKDAYSFDRDEEGLARSYELQAGAYERIFDRCGLRWYKVESDVGMMGGSGAHEYMAPCPAGRERGRAGARLRRQRRGRLGDRAAGRAAAGAGRAGAGLDARPRQGRGGRRRARAAARAPSSRRSRWSSRAAAWSWSCCAATTASTRSSCATRSGPTSARPAPRRSRPRSARPASSARSAPTVPVIKDAAIAGDSYVCGANQADTHLRGVQPGRDFEFEELDVRTVEAGDTTAGGRDDRDRAGDRGRQHLQARHPLLGAARRHLPRRGRRGAADRDGLLRDRPGADRRRRDRAAAPTSAGSSGRRRSRPGRSTSSRSPRPASPSARPPTSSTTSCARPGSRSSTTSARPAPARS